MNDDKGQERQVFDGQIPVSCPSCKRTLIVAAIRQYPEKPGIVDVGFKCLYCNHEWGFEYENGAT